eukprot:4606427-Amphidinium_carterae.2
MGLESHATWQQCKEVVLMVCTCSSFLAQSVFNLAVWPAELHKWLWLSFGAWCVCVPSSSEIGWPLCEPRPPLSQE